MKKSNAVIKIIIGSILIILASVLIICIDWARVQFANTGFSEVMFYLRMPLEGTNTGAFSGIMKRCIIIAPILTLLAALPAIISDTEHVLVIQIVNLKISIPLDLWKKYYILISTSILIISIIYGAIILKIPSYFINMMNSSTLYEDYYTDPSTAEISFPEKKRNLIYIFMESMENSYLSIQEGGLKSTNLIPELSVMQHNGINFSTKNNVNGAIAAVGSTWTVSAMVAQTAGIPLNIPIDGNSMNQYRSFLPGAYSIGDILEEQGYQQIFLLGSDAVFGGRTNYMKQHGNYAIEDYFYAIEKKWIDPNYYVFWGYEDKKLYSNAKTELLRLSEMDQPFNLTMLTVDTHFINGYVCDLCRTDYPDQYSNVISCASRQVADFVSWVKQQPFYENTTIVIAGDHYTMDTEYIKDIPDNYEREVYFTIINSAVNYTEDADRVYTTMDLYPTTLASMGVSINGDRLGLGTNLFSNKPTLAEELSIGELNKQLGRNSKYYNDKILYEQ